MGLTAAIGIFAKAFDQLTPNLLSKITANRIIGFAPPRHQPQRLRRRARALRFVDPIVADHFTQHPIAPGNRGLRIFLPAIGFGRFGQARQKSHFMKLQLVHAFVKIGLCCGLHTKRPPPQRNFIQIERQNLLFGECGFDPLGQQRFLQLADIGNLIIQQEDFGQLLGNGGGADGPAFAAQIADRCAYDPRKIDPAMFKKGFILRRKISVNQQFRKIGIFQ